MKIAVNVFTNECWIVYTLWYEAALVIQLVLYFAQAKAPTLLWNANCETDGS